MSPSAVAGLDADMSRMAMAASDPDVPNGHGGVRPRHVPKGHGPDMSRKDYRRGRRTFNGPASGYGPRMPRYEVEKRHEDGTSTREPYESPHEFAPGDSFMTGGDRWQVESVDGE